MVSDTGVRRGHSVQADAFAAIDELWEQVFQQDAKLTAFFCASSYDLDRIALRVRERFGEANVVGCTTAGEMGPAGCLEDSVSAFSLAGPSFEVVTTRLDGISNFRVSHARNQVQALLGELSAKGVRPSHNNTFGFQLIDPMPEREEVVTSALHSALADIPMIGASAGDGLRFERAFLFHQGKFRTDCVLLSLVTTTRNLALFRAHDFVECGERLIITESDPAGRVVMEINGESAAHEYANAIGVPVEDLSPAVFAEHPVLLSIGGELHARSIRKVREDGSIVFGCAIDQGLVLRAGKPLNDMKSLWSKIESQRSAFGRPVLTLGCDCVYRRLEAIRTGRRDLVSKVLQDNNVVGLVGYGQQIGGLSDGHTFVGMAIGNEVAANVRPR